MKKLILSVSIVSMLFACGGGDSQEESDENMESEEVGFFEAASSLKKLADEAEEMEEDEDILKSITPLSNDELKALLPETLNDLPRTSYSVGMQGFEGLHVVEAGFKNEDESKKIKFSVIDGAGEVGFSFIALTRMALSQDFERSEDGGYEKTDNLGDYKVIKSFTPNDYADESKITLIVAKRFLVTLEGEGVSMDDLESSFESLDLDHLQELASK